MRAWLLRIRTALAVAAAIFLAVNLPQVWKTLQTPLGEPNAAPAPIILRVWVTESFSGTALTWLTQKAALFEKATTNTRVALRRAQAGDWLAEGAVSPDMLLFETGVIENPEGILRPLRTSYDLKPFLSHCGEWRGETYAVPICYSGDVLYINESLTDGPDLVMRSDREYQEFATQRARSLLASPKEEKRLAALRETEKGFSYSWQPIGEATDKLLLAGLTPGEGERAGCAETFLAFLLSDSCQNTLPAQLLLPAGREALPPDAEAQPLLAALQGAISSAASGFTRK